MEVFGARETVRQSGDLEGALETASGVELGEQPAAWTCRPAHQSGQRLTLKGMILGKADAEPSLGRSEEALATFQRGMDITEELAKKDSIDYHSRNAEANMHWKLAIFSATENRKKRWRYTIRPSREYERQRPMPACNSTRPNCCPPLRTPRAGSATGRMRNNESNRRFSCCMRPKNTPPTTSIRCRMLIMLSSRRSLCRNWPAEESH